MTSQAAGWPTAIVGSECQQNGFGNVIGPHHFPSQAQEKAELDGKIQKRCLTKYCDGGKHVVLFYMWWRGDLAYPGAPEVHTEGKWHHLQKVGGPATI